MVVLSTLCALRQHDLRPVDSSKSLVKKIKKLQILCCCNWKKNNKTPDSGKTEFNKAPKYQTQMTY